MNRRRSSDWTDGPGTRPDSSAEFFNRYEWALKGVARQIKERRPEYVLTLPRTGPRLLELMEMAGITFEDTEIISEKSLDFMPSGELRGADTVVFDDIAVSGKTINNIHSYLTDHYGMDVEPVLLAVDRDNLQRENLLVGDRTLSYQMELNQSKRFQFIHEMVNAFSYLNKPYDVDHAIFYSDIGTNRAAEVESLEDCYNLTTSYQAERGFRRYSIIPGETGKSHLDSKLLEANFADVQIEKLRIYYDERTGAIRYTPVSTFSMLEEDVHSYSIFSEDFDVYNELLAAAREHVDSTNSSMALFRLIWYLISYITGVHYAEKYIEEIDNSMTDVPPGELLAPRDLSYLFGPELGREIRSTLRSSGAAARMTGRDGVGSPSESASSSSQQVEPDEDQEWLLDRITGYVADNVNSYSSLSEQVSAIFEGIHVEVEQDALARYDKYGLDTDPPRLERDAGLNYHQILNVLEDNDVDLSDEEAHVGLSLAFDFLIDTGVQIPIFYEREGVLERAYRHGEGVLNNTRYAYLIDEISTDILTEASRRGVGSMSQVSYEKTGVLVGDKLDNEEYWGQIASDLLSTLKKRPQYAGTNTRIEVSPGVYRHGKVQLIERVGSLGSGTLFTRWAENEGIVRLDGEKKVRKSGDWRKKAGIPEDLDLIEEEKVERFRQIALCCYHIYENLGNEPLIAITTCRTEGEFLNAARKEIELVFTNDEYSLSDAIDRLDSLLEDHDAILEKDFVDPDHEPIVSDLEDQIDQSNSAKAAIAGVRHKKKLWKKLDSHIGDIEDLFDEQHRYLSSIYRASLKTYLSNLKEVDRESEPRAAHIRELTVHFGRLTEKLADVVVCLGEASAAIAAQTDVRKKIADLNSSLDEWESAVEADTPGVGGGPLDELSSIDPTDSSLEPLQLETANPEAFKDRRLSLRLVEELLPRIRREFELLQRAYDHRFAKPEWEERQRTFYPDAAPDDHRTIPTEWAVWYDMKQSSVPENERASSRLKDLLVSGFKSIHSQSGGVHFTERTDDSGHVFTDADGTAVRVLEELLAASDDAGIRQRVGVCKTNTNGVTRTEDGKFDSEISQVLSKRLGELIDEHDVIDESQDAHTLTISEDVLYEVGDGSLPDRISDRWNVTKLTTESVPLKGIERRIRVHSFRLDPVEDIDG